MLGTNENKRGKIVFLNVKDGKILRREGLVLEEFDFVEGTLEKIYTKEREFNGERVLYWYLPLRDDNGDLYLLFGNLQGDNPLPRKRPESYSPLHYPDRDLL